MEEKADGAWLENASSDRIPIRGSCSIGRSPRSSIVLDSPKISRRHAIVHIQNIGEFWLIDLGSINGTFLNKRRVHHPVRLSDFDQITVGDVTYVFRQPLGITEEYQATVREETIRQVATVPCWLLVADIEDFTPLSQSMESDKLATLVGGWVSGSKKVIEEHDGLINKYLGDGFLAYWRGDQNAAPSVAEAIKGLSELQAQRTPDFRVALHAGLVAIGGMESMGEESLMGPEVNFVFRMEKLAGSLGLPFLASLAAAPKLDPGLKTKPVGSYELKGFAGRHQFFSC
jgi:adenylate cyclase